MRLRMYRVLIKRQRWLSTWGKIFYSTKNVVAYSKLGIGRLIYQLPPLCRMFIKEIFDGKSPDDFDEETLTTINKFFENSPQRIRDVQAALYPQEHAGVPSWTSFRRVPVWI